ncbi:DcaP family trimeric outer membrane transporter [Carboxylicivirga litoralis]|uniref:DcaP family trimeric outer membrane transporter n=1 Tax=Carboxylicivirga litoralis TaxID=2816963 RepID=UPI0021CB5A30|nr:DcaP family trimeric outer membrane transporter [Carboxylicivirga sp. A043]
MYKLFQTLALLVLVLFVGIQSKAQSRVIGELPDSSNILQQIFIEDAELIDSLITNVDSLKSKSSSSLAEVLFNPEMRLIHGDTIKLKTIEVEEQLTYRQRDSAKIQDIHPQDSPDLKGFTLNSKDGTAQITFKGSIRLNGAYDFNGLAHRDNFKTIDIPVESESQGARFFMSGHQTRFGIEATKKTGLGPILMRLESDYLGTEHGYRLRHVYGLFMDVLAGQTWSVFGDPSSIPWTVDLEGPNSSVSKRTVQIRYSHLLSPKLRWTVSIESPELDLEIADSLRILQDFPDIATRFKRLTNWGHLQTALIFRSLAYNIDQSGALGYGALLSGRYEFNDKKEILFQLVGGRGIAHYISSISGNGLDIAYDETTKEYHPLDIFGGFVSYGVDWNDNIYSYFTPGFIYMPGRSFQPDNTFKFSAYFSGNIFWNVIPGVRVGGEYSYGSRINKDKQKGKANRISFILYYDF